jgi:replication-associated recombination protein RarA
MTDFTPKSTDEMVFSNPTSRTTIHSILKGDLPLTVNGRCGVLFYGVYGTGKTTYAEIFCNEFESIKVGKQENADAEFISCSMIHDFSKTREACEGLRNWAPLRESGLVYYIFDEVNNLKAHQQNWLKEFMNESNIICVLTTNHIDRLDKGLLDRCYKVEFNAAKSNDYLPRLRQIIDQNNLTPLSDKVLLNIVQQSNGSWRNIGSYLNYHCKKKQSFSVVSSSNSVVKLK